MKDDCELWYELEELGVDGFVDCVRLWDVWMLFVCVIEMLGGLKI